MTLVDGCVTLLRKRSASQNLALAILTGDVVPYRYGYAPLLATGTLGTNTPCSPGLYQDAGRAGSDLGIHGRTLAGDGGYAPGDGAHTPT
jgi:hypothetical protein